MEHSDLIYGKIPPQAKDLEEVILGAIMLEKGAIEIALGILQPECFYNEAHKDIYTVMRDMFRKNIPIDMLTMIDALKTANLLDKVGGAYAISMFTKNVVSAANIEFHCRIVFQKFVSREMIRIGADMINTGYDETSDVFERLNIAETNIFGLSQNFITKDFSTIADSLVKVVRRIEELRTVDQSITGVPTGFEELDRITHGWQPTDLIILAARPSVGKTAFALNLARNAAMHPEKPIAVGFFSLEMSEEQLVTRILSAQSEIWLESLNTGRLDDSQLEHMYIRGVDPLRKAPIIIDDTAGLNMFQLRSKARKMLGKHNIGLIIIDYLQLMSGEGNRNGNREQEISKISRELKILAKELKVPIIALSQLSREVEKRGKGMKAPQLSDLRESGAIEQDADLVMFLYRPPEDEVAEDADLKNKGMGKIAKHRNGKLVEIAFEVSNDIQKWKEVGTIFSKPSTPRLIPIDQANKQQPFKFPYKDNDEDLPF